MAEDYLKRDIPVIVTDAMLDWPAKELFTVNFIHQVELSWGHVMGGSEVMGLKRVRDHAMGLGQRSWGGWKRWSDVKLQARGSVVTWESGSEVMRWGRGSEVMQW